VENSLEVLELNGFMYYQHVELPRTVGLGPGPGPLSQTDPKFSETFFERLTILVRGNLVAVNDKQGVQDLPQKSESSQI
jgi:hypothetical protein